MQRLRIIFKSGHVETLLAEKWDLCDPLDPSTCGAGEVCIKGQLFVKDVNITGTNTKQALKILDYSTLAAVVVEDVGADPYRAG